MYGIRYLTTGDVTQKNFIKYGPLFLQLDLTFEFRYVEHDSLIWEYLNSSIHLAPYLDKKFNRIYAGKSYKFYRQRFENILEKFTEK